MHLIELAFSLAADNAGNSIAARIAMMAMTTNSSISVKAAVRAPRRSDKFLCEVLIAKLTVGNQGRGTTHPQVAALFPLARGCHDPGTGTKAPELRQKDS